MAFPASSSLPLDKPLTIDSAGKTNVLQLLEYIAQLPKCITQRDPFRSEKVLQLSG